MHHHRHYPLYKWPYSARQGLHSFMTASDETLLGLRFDIDGYLLDPDEWDESLAEYLADRAGWPLNPPRWAIINALRHAFFEQGGNPTLRHVCHIARLDRHCINTHFDCHGRDVWRIAGLPNPGEEVQTYMQ